MISVSKKSIPNSLLSLLFVLGILANASAQVSTVPLNSNKTIIKFLEHNSNYNWSGNLKTKFGTRDTLQLPFFDDFSTSSIYPDSSKWLNNQVYVNNHFPQEPPTLNVATFDVLDHIGLPYRNTINKDFNGAGDSLISQPINLQDSAGVTYSLADSMVLSFFIQPNGNGYHLTDEDSIRLFFKSENGVWLQVWSKPGSDNAPFEHITVPIEESFYLHKGFQFMFTTFTRQVGNANHWHLDYIYLDSRRSVTIDYYNDYAIQSFPSSLLKEYYSLPYDHYLASSSNLDADSVYVYVSNLYNIAKNINIRHEAFEDGKQLVSTAFEQNANNVLAYKNAERRLKNYNISSLTGAEPKTITRGIEIQENGVINEFKDNDFVTATQVFDDYYAYDDGTAERGFGFDQNANPSNIEGEVALAFDVLKKDTLYAISTYFNQAVYDVGNRKFRYVIWKELDGVGGADEDSIIYRSDEQVPIYNVANDRRTFTAFYLDSTIIMEPGRYYIGWYQRSMFNLNVGWDMNFGRRRNNQATNPKLYYKLFNVWSNKNLPNGTLMMRPHFGAAKQLHAGVKPVFRETQRTTSAYPNPASSVVHFGLKVKNAELYSVNGKLVKSIQNAENMSLLEIDNGIYWLSLTTENGQQLRSKLVIFAR